MGNRCMECEESTYEEICCIYEKYAEVIEVGPGKNIDGKIQQVAVKKGDNVIVSKYAGTEVKYEGVDYIIVKQEDVLAIVD